MADRREFVCIVCPRGCLLEVEFSARPGGNDDARSMEILSLSGNQCRRGDEYASGELIDPRRSLTSTVRTASKAFPRLAVRGTAELPLARLAEAARVLDAVVAPLGCRVGDILARDILGLGVDIVASDDMPTDEAIPAAARSVASAPVTASVAAAIRGPLSGEKAR